MRTVLLSIAAFSIGSAAHAQPPVLDPPSLMIMGRPSTTEEHASSAWRASIAVCQAGGAADGTSERLLSCLKSELAGRGYVALTKEEYEKAQEESSEDDPETPDAGPIT